MKPYIEWPPEKSCMYKFDPNPEMVIKYDRGPIKNTNNENKGIERD